jgi:hypothetical protein
MASRERQEIGVILYRPHNENALTVVKPAANTLIPILELLALIKRPQTEMRSDAACSAASMLREGKKLPYGSRFFYIGPDRTGEEYAALDTLRYNHIFPEYFILDEKNIASSTYRSSRLYQIKEAGYDIV